MLKKIFVIFLSSILITTLTNTSLAKLNLNTNDDDNLPPYPPSITVPNNITVGKLFRIDATVIDPDGDDIYVRFNASFLPVLPNFWLGPFPSGFIYTVLVKYRGPIGNYTLGVQAKDVYDAESEWTYVQFNITKVKSYNNMLLNLLKNPPYLFHLFKDLLNMFG